MANDLDRSLGDLGAAIAEFLKATDAARPQWTVPRGPGKWSPSQVAEHVARIMEQSANVVVGTPSNFPTIPTPFRPIIRAFMFRRILRRKAFLTMKAIEAFDPPVGSPTPEEGRRRLEEVLVRFKQACHARSASGQAVASTIFGSVPVADFARFQELHVRHHLQQLPKP